jgi:hypothetical protein
VRDLLLCNGHITYHYLLSSVVPSGNSSHGSSPDSVNTCSIRNFIADTTLGSLESSNPTFLAVPHTRTTWTAGFMHITILQLSLWESGRRSRKHCSSTILIFEANVRFHLHLRRRLEIVSTPTIQSVEHTIITSNGTHTKKRS